MNESELLVGEGTRFIYSPKRAEIAVPACHLVVMGAGVLQVAERLSHWLHDLHLH